MISNTYLIILDEYNKTQACCLCHKNNFWAILAFLKIGQWLSTIRGIIGSLIKHFLEISPIVELVDR